MSRAATLLSWTAWSRRRQTWHSRETPCCSPRDARPWTCSRTTARAATRSPSPCAGSATGRGDRALPGDTTEGLDVTTATGQQRPRSAVAGGLPGRVRALRHALDRPLTSYYLLLGASTLLLTIGLVMVLGASSVSAYRDFGSSYHYVLKQLMWVGLALPVAFVVAKLPLRVLRGLAWPGLIVATVLVGLTQIPGVGVEVNGNTNWLALGPL